MMQQRFKRDRMGLDAEGTPATMKTARVLRQLERVSGEHFIAAGKFVPRGVVAGTVLGALGGALPAAAAGGLAAMIGRRRAKKKSELAIPRVTYVAVTDSQVVLFKGANRMFVAPARPREVLTRWPRSQVDVVRRRGLVNVVTEFHVRGADRPIGLVSRRLDASARDVVLLLDADERTQFASYPADAVPSTRPARGQAASTKPAGPKQQASRKRATTKKKPATRGARTPRRSTRVTA